MGKESQSPQEERNGEQGGGGGGGGGVVGRKCRKSIQTVTDTIASREELKKAEKDKNDTGKHQNDEIKRSLTRCAGYEKQKDTRKT